MAQFARNAGLKVAEGEYVFFLDDDTITKNSITLYTLKPRLTILI